MALRPNPPLTEEESPLAVLAAPPLTEDPKALAVLTLPVLTPRRFEFVLELGHRGLERVERTFTRSCGTTEILQRWGFLLV